MASAAAATLSAVPVAGSPNQEPFSIASVVLILSLLPLLPTPWPALTLLLPNPPTGPASAGPPSPAPFGAPSHALHTLA